MAKMIGDNLYLLLFIAFVENVVFANTTLVPLYLLPLQFVLASKKFQDLVEENDVKVMNIINFSSDNTTDISLIDVTDVPTKIPSTTQGPLKNPGKSPVRLTMKQGLLMNQVLGFYALDNSRSELCKNHSQDFKNGLRYFEPWALKMFDASAKLQSGILLGNLYEFGSFLQCLEVETNTQSGPLYGKHCAIKIVPSIDLIEKILAIRNVSKTRFNLVKVTVETAEIHWSVCVPHSCPTEDILQHYKKKIMEMAEGLDVTIELQDNYCQTVFDKPKFGLTQWIVLAFLATFVIISFATGYIDYAAGKNATKNFLVSIFSIHANIQKIFAKGLIHPEFNFLHGLRFISTCYVVLGHRYIMFLIDPTINSLGIIDWVLEYPSFLILGSSVSVDSFFMISGMLLSIGFFNIVHKLKKFNWFLFYLHRYLRITLPLAINLIIWCTLVQFLGNGILMYNVYLHHQKNCQDFWWSTLLHLQTYVNPGKWCNYPIWYLSCEMTFFYISPIFLYPLWKWPRFGLSFCVLFYISSISLGFYLAFINRYSGTTLPVTSHLLINEYFKNYYTQPHVRIPPYVIGIVFGYFIYKTREKTFVISRTVNITLWALSGIIMLTTLFGGRKFQLETHQYNVIESSSYLAFSRSAWTFCLVWIVWCCLNGYGEFFTPDNTTYNFIKLNHNFFKIKVKASNDVHIGLFSTSVVTAPWYEIVIGGWGNTKSVIRKDMQDVVALNVKQYLNKDEYREFWVRFSNNTVLVGLGGEIDPIMVYRDPEGVPDIVYTGIHTGFGSTGKWVVNMPRSNWKLSTECENIANNVFLLGKE